LVNPILVKETRQALKSRQFLITFSLLLVAAFGWTVVGSLMRMPQIYTAPTAPFMLVGYYVVLAVPMLLVVPLAAYRSLESELDDGTLELLSISILSPWQIVLGKLASAGLQMTLYFVALFPCVAFAYTLRGIDLPTLLIVMAFLFVSGGMLTVAALCFAPQSRSRSGRIFSLLLVLGMLLVGEYVIGGACITMILYGIPFEADLIGYAIVFTLLTSFAAANLLITTTAVMLTPESENRSTRLRLALLLLTAVMFALVAFGVVAFEEVSLVFAVPTFVVLGILWLAAAAMMVAESPAMTPRIRRELPSSFVARMTWTFLTPGPATGLIFGCLGLLSVAAAGMIALEYLDSQPVGARGVGFPRGDWSFLGPFASKFLAYAVVFLVAARWLVFFVRKFQNVRVEFGLAAVVVVAVLAAIIPYSIGLYLSDSFSFRYTPWQITNWAWTLSEDPNVLPAWIDAVLAGAAMISFFTSLAMSSEIALPRKTALPERVIEERQRERSVKGPEK